MHVMVRHPILKIRKIFQAIYVKSNAVVLTKHYIHASDIFNADCDCLSMYQPLLEEEEPDFLKWNDSESLVDSDSLVDVDQGSDEQCALQEVCYNSSF